MRINLFDSGEGASSLQILDPNGNPTPFSWSTPCNPPTPPDGERAAGTATAPDPNARRVGERLPSPTPGLHSPSKYNDRFITIDIPLAAELLDRLRTATKVRRGGRSGTTSAATPTDRTTWSVNIVGDPVHLLQ